MWLPGNQIVKPYINLNQHFLDNLKGTLEDKEAKITLAQFLYHNVGVTAELMSSVKLFPFQELIIRSWFKRNYNLAVWGRGGSKSWTVAMFCCLYQIFHPDTRIVLIAQNFRTARRIFESIQKFVNSKNAVLLQQCFGVVEPRRRTDSWEWNVNEGTIIALPLAQGDKIRGTRADVLIVDEFALISEEIYKKVLLPFLAAKQPTAALLRQRRIEDRLIARGQMKEEERADFSSDKKVIALSSASYQFEYLYTMYKEWIANIIEPKDDIKSTYFVSQLSYEVLPTDLIEETVIEEAASGGAENAVFLREYCARFTDDSDSYFKAKKMSDCTIPDKQTPTIEIIGAKGADYMLAIDTNFSSSESSDDFAMSVLKINRETRTGTLVHSYAASGTDLKEHIRYAYYILRNFNIVYVIMDKAGAEPFIQACNSSSLFQSAKLDLTPFESDFDNNDYAEGVKLAKRSYKPTLRKFVHLQQFQPASIRKMNEWLQSAFDTKKIWFASRATAHETEYPRLLALELPDLFHDCKNEQEKRDKMMELIDEQGALIDLTKKECSLIEVQTEGSTGHQRFDLPNHLKKSTKANRARKDNYTTLMLGNWGLKCLFDLESEPEQNNAGFRPFFGE